MHRRIARLQVWMRRSVAPALGLGLGLSTLVQSHALGAPDLSAAAAQQPVRAAGNVRSAVQPLTFEPNLGQVSSGASFVAHAPASVVHFSPTEVAIVLNTQTAPRAASDPPQARRRSVARVLHSRFLGSSPATKIEVRDAAPGVKNYLLGNDPRRWRTGVPTFDGLSYVGLYAGIDLSYSGSDGNLKGTYTVAPGADPSLIRWRYDGARNVSVDAAGNVVLDAVDRNLVEQAPVAWQERNGQRATVEARYSRAADGSFGFTLGAYDHAQPLIIDPTVVFSTYLGGSGADEARDVKVDATGNIYLVGTAASTDYPTQAAQQPNNRGLDDIVVTKLNPAGSAVLFSTYLGGTGDDFGRGLALDSQGNILLTGQISSADFPIRNAFQPQYAGNWDAFITKLSNDGATLLYSSYYGGSPTGSPSQDPGDDMGLTVEVDGSGRSYISGLTAAVDLPVKSAVQATYGGGPYDGFAAKVDTTQVGAASLVYSTFVGGSGEDYAESLNVEASGSAYLTGRTSSPNFVTRNALQAQLAGGYDAFVTRLSADGSTVLYSSYFGGSGTEKGYDVALDGLGNAFLTGMSLSVNMPTSATAFQRAINGGGACPNGDSAGDAYALKINTNATGQASLVYSTYLGGGGCDAARGIAVDQSGNAYITGWTDSPNFPLQGAVQPSVGGAEDAFVSVVNASGSALLFSTYLGGSGNDYGRAVWVDGGGNMLLTGSTESANFPGTGGSLFPYRGGGDAFLTKLSPLSGGTSATSTPTPTPTPPTTASGYAASVLANQPVLYWRLGESSGAAAADASGHGNTGSYLGGATLGSAGALAGDPDPAVTLDGISGHVSLAQPSGVPLAGPFSVEAWVRPTAQGGRIVNKGAGYGDWTFSLDPSRQVYLALTPDGSSYCYGVGPVALAASTWAHVVATFDGTRAVVYVNGVAGSAATCALVPANRSPAITVGQDLLGGTQFAGGVDEVALYPAVLTAAQVQAHYAAGTSGAAATATPSPTPTRTPVTPATATPSPTPTRTPVTPATATPSPTTVAAATATSTRTPTPTRTPAPSPQFGLQVTPTSASVARGQSVSYTVTLTSSNGFSGSVSLSGSGLPSKTTAAFSTNPVSLAVGSTVSTTMVVTAGDTAALGARTLSIVGVSGSQSVTRSVALTVTR